MKGLIERLRSSGDLIAKLLPTPEITEPVTAIGGKVHIVDIPAYLALFPLYGVGVELLPDIGLGHIGRTTVLIPRPRKSVMQSAVQGIERIEIIGTGAKGLEDIDLATVWPAAVNGIGRQHPDSGPYCLTIGYTGAHFHAAKGPIGLATGAQSCR